MASICLDRSGFAVVTVPECQRCKEPAVYCSRRIHCVSAFCSHCEPMLINWNISRHLDRGTESGISLTLALKLPPKSGISLAKAATWPY